MKTKYYKKNQKKIYTNTFVKIIGGMWKSRKLLIYHSSKLRPTTHRIRETLFNWIEYYLPTSHCLDIFAGSGSLGFEAASRNAKTVTMIEINYTAYNHIQRNKKLLSANNIEIFYTHAYCFLKKKKRTYDVIFIDPPFKQGLIDNTIQLLEKNKLLSHYAIIYIESEKDLQLKNIPTHWYLHRQLVTKNTNCQLFVRNSIS